ncbi:MULTISPECIES: hypothetical protein [unclassified Streptomyces]|uniref:hypothetical protein n=1 Tax=unclassified Streptomyces TaxID=2593676 RepID=UPI0036467C4D
MGNMEHSMVVAGSALIAIEFARSIPAWLRVRRTGSSDGVSPISVGVLGGTGIGWIAVAVMADSLAGVIATIVWLTFHFLLWREVARCTPSMARTITTASNLSLAATGLVALIGHLAGHLETFLGGAITAASAFYSLPALFSGMRSRTTNGLSLVSLSVNSLEGGIYLASGVGLGGITAPGDPILAYAFFGGLALVSNIPRVIRTGYRRILGKDQAYPIFPQEAGDDTRHGPHV